MGDRTLRPLSLCAALAPLVLLMSCASPGPALVTEGREPLVSKDSDAADASFDWHVLLIEPLGVLLHDVRPPLHEVLLFHDDTVRGAGDNKDCYSIGGAAPRFLGERSDSYLMCFDHDRLNRVEATVRLPAARAPGAFARACSRWLKSTGPMLAESAACEGRDGGVNFSARLSLQMGEPAAIVSMTLTPAGSGEGAGDSSDGT